MEGHSLAATGRRFHVSTEAVRQWMSQFEEHFWALCYRSPGLSYGDS